MYSDGSSRWSGSLSASLRTFAALFVKALLISYSVIPLLLLVARSKLVPDFAFTIHFINLVITSLYTRAVPTNPLWWALQVGSTALMVALGVWACRYREMKPISFPTLPSTGSKSTKVQPNGGASEGGGSYEMVASRDVEAGR